MITEISKGRSSVGTSAIQNIVLLYNISGEWLLTGKGPMLKSEEQPLPEAKKTNSKHKGIPLIPMEAIAGFPAIDNDGVRFEDCQHYSIPEFEAKGADFLIRVSGDSMTPLYCNGDIIACRKRRLHPLRLRKQALQALFPPKRRHPLTQHHRRPRPPGLAMMSPGSAGFCTLLLCSSPVVSIPSPPKHPSRPLLYPSRTPLAPPFRGVFTGLYAIYNNV